MDYDIIYAGTVPSLVQRVKAATIDGWLPQGGMAVVRTGNADFPMGSWVYFQAMVKTDGSFTVQYGDPH